jgi:capsular polysaccharide export protein
MQMDTDFSIRAYSPFASNQEALEATIASFARAAAPEAQLLIKVHPLDPGLRHWPGRVRAIARQFGVANRVHYLGGALHMDRTLEACRTVVTVNSTLAFRALQLGRPVLALGHALYDIPGLTWQQGIDAFWRNATAPDPVLAEAFLRAVAACLQIRGTAFAQPGLEVAVRNAVYRLHHRLLNRPVAGVLS